MSSSDLRDYAVKQYEALSMTLNSGDVIYSLRPPSSGVLLGFMLRILEGLFH